MTRKRKKPTKNDLLALLQWAAGEIGGIRGDYQNDRDPDRAGTIVDRTNFAQNRLLEAIGHFPVPDPSPWTDK